MKNNFKSVLMFIAVSLLGLSTIKPIIAHAEDAPLIVDLPDFTESTFTNFGWNASMNKEVVEELVISEKYISIEKTSAGEGFNLASVYYQNFGTVVSSLAGEYTPLAVKVKVNVPTAFSGSGLSFIFSGTEQFVIEAYDEDSTTDLSTRDLDYTGRRNYVVPFPDGVTPTSVTEFQIGIWGSGLGIVQILGLELKLADVEVSTTVKNLTPFPAIDEAQFTQFGWNSTVAKSNILIDSVNWLKIDKTSITDLNNNNSNLYYQNFGSTIETLNSTDHAIAIKLDVNVETPMNKSGLMFLFGGVEQGTVEAYEEGSDVDLATRNLDFTGIRTYVIAFPDPSAIRSVGEFQIGVWGQDEGTVNVNNLVLVTEKESDEVITDEQFVPFAEFTVDTFTNFGFNCEMMKNFNEGEKLVGPFVHIEKINHIDPVNEANVYYQAFGSIVNTASAGKKINAVLLDVYVPDKLSESNLGFKVLNTWVTDVSVSSPDLETTYPLGLDYQGLRTYRVNFGDLSVKDAGEFQIALTGVDHGSVYLSNFRVEVSEEIDNNPGLFTRPTYSCTFESFNTELDVEKWGVSGTPGTVYVKKLNSDSTYISDGDGSLNLSLDNDLYNFGWTEIYYDVSDIIAKNSDKNPTGISFDLYSVAEEEVGMVGYWVKIAEKDGSEYEFNYTMTEVGTKLDFVGWRDTYIPFAAVNNLQSYTVDENETLDIDQIAFVKFGLWTNAPREEDVSVYVDNLKVWSVEKIEISEVIDPNEEDPDDIKAFGPLEITLVSCGGFIILAGIFTIVIMLKRKK